MLRQYGVIQQYSWTMLKKINLDIITCMKTILWLEPSWPHKWRSFTEFEQTLHTCTQIRKLSSSIYLAKPNTAKRHLVLLTIRFISSSIHLVSSVHVYCLLKCSQPKPSNLSQTIISQSHVPIGKYSSSYVSVRVE